MMIIISVKSSIVPVVMIRHINIGLTGCGVCGIGGVAATVWKQNVALHSLGTGSTAIIRQK